MISSFRLILELEGVTNSEISAVCVYQTRDIYPKGRLRHQHTAQIFGGDVYVNVSHPDKAIKTTIEL